MASDYKDSGDHAAKFNPADGTHTHPDSLSQHVGEDLAALKNKVSQAGHTASNVVRNLTGSREIGKLFQGEN